MKQSPHFCFVILFLLRKKTFLLKKKTSEKLGEKDFEKKIPLKKILIKKSPLEKKTLCKKKKLFEKKKIL